MWQRYGKYLVSLGDPQIPDMVFSCIEKEDTPRSVTYQMALHKKAGFRQMGLLYKNTYFAAFGGMK